MGFSPSWRTEQRNAAARTHVWGFVWTITSFKFLEMCLFYISLKLFFWVCVSAKSHIWITISRSMQITAYFLHIMRQNWMKAQTSRPDIMGAVGLSAQTWRQKPLMFTSSNRLRQIALVRWKSVFSKNEIMNKSGDEATKKSSCSWRPLFLLGLCSCSTADPPVGMLEVNQS